VEFECERCFSIVKHKDLMPSVETCWMHGAHLQTTAIYNYGDGVSQERFINDGVSRESSTSEENKHKRINVLESGCKCCVKL